MTFPKNVRSSSMKNRPPLILLICFIISVDTFGQNDFRDGYIITLEQDTLRGQVDYRSNVKNYVSCLFKNTNGEREYFPDQITGFGYVDDRFFSSEVVDGWFAEVLVLGEMSLYKFEEKYLIKKNDELYELEAKAIEEENEAIGTKKDNRWKGIVTFLINDCMSDYGETIRTLTLGEKSITRLVLQYNDCKNTNSVVFKANKPWTKFELGAAFGVVHSNIGINEKSVIFRHLDNSYNSLNPSFGLVFKVSFPRLSESLAFQSELHFLKSNYASLIEMDGVPLEYHDTFINLNLMSIPLSVKYSLPEKKYGLYFQGGINLDFYFNSNARVFSESIFENVVTTFPESQAFEINKSQFGIWAGAGLRKSLNRYRLDSSIRYTQITGFTDAEGLKTSHNRISLHLIIFKE